MAKLSNGKNTSLNDKTKHTKTNQTLVTLDSKFYTQHFSIQYPNNLST